ncbi:MAG TPA: hypothetical protein VFO67_07970 [Gemmatimonadales bacterium]|nr:hypothetical protein [Gemmatimonadales bacterium]
MRIPKLIQRLGRKPKAFSIVPLIPIALVVTDAVFAILNQRRLKRLEARVARPRAAAARA